MKFDFSILSNWGIYTPFLGRFNEYLLDQVKNFLEKILLISQV